MGFPSLWLAVYKNMIKVFTLDVLQNTTADTPCKKQKQRHFWLFLLFFYTDIYVNTEDSKKWVCLFLISYSSTADNPLCNTEIKTHDHASTA